MKKLTLTIIILSIIGVVGYAGSERISGKDKEIMQSAPPPCDWYRAHEWDLMLWGTYAIPGNNDENSHRFHFTGPLDGSDPSSRPKNFKDYEDVNDQPLGDTGVDQLINRGGAWGGGADVKYFFSKYWALGAEGFVLDANTNAAGAGLGTFTFRWPIGCSRFAPYAFAGFGAMGGGSHTIATFTDRDTVDLGESNEFGEEGEFESIKNHSIKNTRTEAIGQFGAGLEIRVTRRIGLMSDFAWNVVSGPQNNFGMGRFGVTLSY